MNLRDKHAKWAKAKAEKLNPALPNVKVAKKAPKGVVKTSSKKKKETD